LFRASCIQFCARRTPEDNLDTVTRLIDEAAGRGADLIMTPEQTGLIETDGKRMGENTYAEADDPMLAHIEDLARRHARWILIGSLAIRLESGKLANRSYLIAPDGLVAAHCDKIHMFDVALGSGETYRESKRYEPGEEAVVAPLPWGPLGLSVCYDLRFPALYRRQAQAGAIFFTIPSAFTVPTGEAHSHVLLRARAVENGAFVFAPAQTGSHEAGRRTYGHSLMVGPWGEVLADAGEHEDTVIVADIDPTHAAAARRRIPALAHDRPYLAPEPAGSTDDRKLAS